MAEKITLETLDKKFDDRFTRLEQLIERGFVADVLGDGWAAHYTLRSSRLVDHDRRAQLRKCLS
jgi:hypothetical protein